MKLEFESNVAAAPPFAGNYAADVASADEKGVSRMLQAGVKAAQEGSRSEARSLLLQVVEAAPDNENAWLWLASISDYPEELLVFLNNVLNINPNNARALEWAHATKSLLAKNFVQRGVDASNEAQMDLARQCFLQAVVHDERNEMAWFWLASISDSAEEKLSHLQKVLHINPENETALTALQNSKTQVTESLLRKANTAAIAGEREAASAMLQTILRQSPESEAAWILKSYLAESFSDKIVCFEKVLSINPDNDAANSGLASLREMMTRTENRKSQNLAVIAAFLADAPERNQAAMSSETVLADENTENPAADGELSEISEISELIEDAPIVFVEVETENPMTRATELLPATAEFTLAAVELEDNSFLHRETVREQIPKNYRESETTAADDYQSAETTAADDRQAKEIAAATEGNNPAVIKSESGGAFENRSPSFAGYSAQEVYAPSLINLEFGGENALEADYSPDLTAETPFEPRIPAVKKIMVIDDSAMVRKLIAQKLEASGYEVICAADGIEALETIKQFVPNLILLDTAMPRMDGYQVCQSIRNNDATRDVPIVMISGKDGFFDKVRGQMSGSTGYIAKPFGPETLMKTVESYIVQ